MYVKFVTNTKPCILKLALINTTSKFIYYSLEEDKVVVIFVWKKQLVDWNFVFLWEIIRFCDLIYAIMSSLDPSCCKNNLGIQSQRLVNVAQET